MVAGNSITETNTVPAAARPHTALAFAALVLGASAMGASPIFVRLADVGPQASAFWRAFLALPFLWVWARWEGNISIRGTSPRLRGEVKLRHGVVPNASANGVDLTIVIT